MADYIPVIDSSVDPDAPLTSDLMYRLRDNPIAIAEGSVNAPKVRSGALNLATAAGNVTADGTITTMNGLDRVSVLMVNSYVLTLGTGSSSAQVRYRTSNNGGSTWTGYTTWDSTNQIGGGSNSSVRYGFLNLAASVNSVQFDLSSTSGTTAAASVSLLGVRGVSP